MPWPRLSAHSNQRHPLGVVGRHDPTRQRARVKAPATLTVMMKREQREAAAILERLAGTVAKGEITAPTGFVGRLEGAAASLKVMSQPRPRERPHPRT